MGSFRSQEVSKFFPFKERVFPSNSFLSLIKTQLIPLESWAIGKGVKNGWFHIKVSLAGFTFKGSLQILRSNPLFLGEKAFWEFPLFCEKTYFLIYSCLLSSEVMSLGGLIYWFTLGKRDWRDLLPEDSVLLNPGLIGFALPFLVFF